MSIHNDFSSRLPLSEKTLFTAFLSTFFLGIVCVLALLIAVIYLTALFLNITIQALAEVIASLHLLYTQSDHFTQFLMILVALYLFTKLSRTAWKWVRK